MADELARGNDDDALGDYLDLAALYSSVVPGLGGAISSVLSSMATDRKIRRVRDVIEGIADDLKGFKSDVSSRYVRTEEFEDLLEAALRRASEERDEARRAIYRSFIVNAIREPGSYDQRTRVLRLISELERDHVRRLRHSSARAQQHHPRWDRIAR